ncbi:MAG: hypothetical protein AB1428_14850 [Bacteroidota bacterium]
MSKKADRQFPAFGLRAMFAGRMDVRWCAFWTGGMAILWLWLKGNLNQPALTQIETACVNTLVGALGVVTCSLLLGWGTAMVLHYLDRPRRRKAYLAVSFLLNLLRSVPQMVGMLLGYVALTILIRGEVLPTKLAQLLAVSGITSLFIFQEVADLIRERIRHFMQSDFVNALLVCGVPEITVINREILRKNSFAYLVQKAVSVFGTGVFLVCSIDFIISVGLSTDVSLSNFPVTLGSMLAKLDSKQDILVIGTALIEPRLIPTLFVEHLQGVSVALIIVFTLLSVYKISNGLVDRYRL